MVIGCSYRITRNAEIESNEVHLCPFCHVPLVYRDRVKRIVRSRDGVKTVYMIRRLKCPSCQAMHRELPDFMVPYRHYCKDVIDGVLRGQITPETIGYEDYPSELTMKRWLKFYSRLDISNFGADIKEKLVMEFNVRRVPCKNCPDRKPSEAFPNAKNCHDGCAKYLEWRDKNRLVNERAHDFKERERLLRKSYSTWR